MTVTCAQRETMVRKNSMTRTQTAAVKAVFKEAALTPTEEIRLNHFVFSRDTTKTSKQTEARVALG